MSPEVICALITFGGVVFSAIISYAISRSTANKEIEKMQLAWQREDVISSDDEFSAMAGAVAKYLQYPAHKTRRDAIEQIAIIRAKENGALGQMMDELYLYVYNDEIGSANEQLSKVIDQKRESKRNTNAAKRKNP